MSRNIEEALIAIRQVSKGEFKIESRKNELGEQITVSIKSIQTGKIEELSIEHSREEDEDLHESLWLGNLILLLNKVIEHGYRK